MQIIIQVVGMDHEVLEKIVKLLVDIRSGRGPASSLEPLPRGGLERLIAYSVKTSRELEATDVRNTVVWRLRA